MGSGGYIDSDWVGCVVERKSTLGCGFGLGSRVISLFNGEIEVSGTEFC
jgi:hypothetical protein